MTRIHPLYLDTKDLNAEQLESFGGSLAEWQRGVNWWIGDVARHARRTLGDNYSQVFPAWMSPGLIQRCEAVASAYPREQDRNPLATWAQHMQVASRPNRIELVKEMVEKGQTSDESRAAIKEEKAQANRQWLLAIDVHYFLHRFWFSGAGVEAAVSVATWVQRTVERLKAKGLTDVVCCFDSKLNHRKELTAEWDDKYKDRPPKDPELVQQLELVYQLLKGHGFCCCAILGMEADDCLASFAKQFPGKVTLFTQDKDCRQCLSDKCNMLLDVEWSEDAEGGEPVIIYKWLSAKQHTEMTGIRPDQWTEFQCIMGDATDGITGARGIGEKGAADLVKTFGTVEAAIEAAKVGDERIKPAKRLALIEFGPKLSVTRRLVTLRTDLKLPKETKI